MKTLLILRHAKSSWDDPTLDDHDRPLNLRGLKTAPLMGQLIKEKDLVPDMILSSTALRAVDTAQLIARACGIAGKVQMIEHFYPGSNHDYITTLAQQKADTPVIMIIGHNPGLEIFLEHLTGRKEHLPTAALAQIHLPIESWMQSTSRTKGVLVNIFRPREIFENL